MTGRGEEQPATERPQWERGYSYSRQAGGKRGGTRALTPGVQDSGAARAPAPRPAVLEPREKRAWGVRSQRGPLREEAASKVMTAIKADWARDWACGREARGASRVGTATRAPLRLSFFIHTMGALMEVSRGCRTSLFADSKCSSPS